MKIDLGTLRLGALLKGAMVISLESGEFLRLEPGGDVQVRCDSGRLWITREEDPSDLWLKGGETALVDPKGLTLIEAVGFTKLSIGRPAA
jgi:hypothetical protein